MDVHPQTKYEQCSKPRLDDDYCNPHILGIIIQERGIKKKHMVKHRIQSYVLPYVFFGILLCQLYVNGDELSNRVTCIHSQLFIHFELPFFRPACCPRAQRNAATPCNRPPLSGTPGETNKTNEASKNEGHQTTQIQSNLFDWPRFQLLCLQYVTLPTSAWY
jgi:hypothetical protein